MEWPMRFKKIILENIASFRNKTIIDFDSLPPDEIFAITGPTGSGKSTIINSIGLALFGRSIKGGSHSKDYVTTGQQQGSIELDFEHSGHIYKAQWICKTQRKDGTDLKNVQVKRVFYKDNQIFDDEIEKIIPLSFEQFTKTIILPQGDFANFLSASFTYRKEILEKIVSNLNLGEINSYLKQKHKDEKLQISNLRDQLNIGLPYSDREIQMMIDDYSLVEKKSSELKLILGNFDLYYERVKNILSLIETIDRFRLKMHNYEETYQNLYKKIQTQIYKRDEAKIRVENALKEEANNRPKLLKAIQLENDLLGYSDQISSKKNEVKNLAEQIEQGQNAHDEIESEMNACTQKIQKILRWIELFNYNSFSDEFFLSLCNKTSNLLSEYDNISRPKEDCFKQGLILKNDLYVLKDRYSICRLQIDNLSEINAKEFENIQKIISELDIQIQNVQNNLQDIKRLDNEILSLNEQHIQNKKILESLNKNKCETLTKIELKQKNIKIHQLEESILICQEHAKKTEICPVCDRPLKYPLNTKNSSAEIEKLLKEEKILNDNLKEIEEEIVKVKNIEYKLEQSCVLLKLERNKFNKANLSIFSNFNVTTLEDLTSFNHKKSTELESYRTHLSLKEKNQVQIENLRERIKEIEIKIEINNQTFKAFKTRFESIQFEINQFFEQIERKTSLLSPYFKQQKLTHYIKSRELLLQAKTEFNLHQKRLFESKNRLTENSDKFIYLNKLIQKLEEDVISIQKELIHFNNQGSISASQALIKLSKSTQDAHDFQKEVEENFQSINLSLKESETTIKMCKDNINQSKTILSQEILEINGLSAQIKNKHFPVLNEEFVLSSKENNSEILEFLNANIQSEIHNLKNDLNTYNRKLNENSVLIDLYHKKKQKLMTIREQLNLIEEKFKATSTLVDIIGRDEFRSYALSIIEDSIITQANHELQFLASGRYLLESESNKGSSEFFVYDRWFAHKKRKVSTLSGGETFLVSLSLALGLSSVIKGTTEINSFFIDEGFGTLDEETLEEVSETLFRLGKSGKQIGIISHVKKLTDQIPVQINLKKSSANGSFSQMVIN